MVRDIFPKSFRESCPGQRGALKKYRRAILKNYGEHALGFRSEGFVNVKQVYVPLQYDDRGHRRDVAEAINSSNRIVVVGEPERASPFLIETYPRDVGRCPCSRGAESSRSSRAHRCNVTDVSLDEPHPG